MQLELGQGLLPETAHEAQRTAACQAPRCWYKQKPGGHGQSQGQGVGAKSAKESGTSPRVGGAGVPGRHAGSGGRQSGPGWARGVVDALAPGTSLLRSFLQHADSVSVMASRKSLLLFSGLMKKAIVIRTP